ncbi:hypothetical protein U2F10_21720 [Leptothoe sp. EHU-05/26/07-4]
MPVDQLKKPLLQLTVRSQLYRLQSLSSARLSKSRRQDSFGPHFAGVVAVFFAPQLVEPAEQGAFPSLV